MIGDLFALDDAVASMPAHRHAKGVEPVSSTVVVGVEEAHQLDSLVGGERAPVALNRLRAAALVQGAR
jgi:hypothetical protein